MPPAIIQMGRRAFEELRNHLLPTRAESEEAAFIFARPREQADCLALEVVEIMLMIPHDFKHRSRYALELTDESRARVIRAAHQLGCSIVECHSHPGQRIACFSWSDLHGFDEFVPHVRWRLPGRPYAALVFAGNSFDALLWATPGPRPSAIESVTLDNGECLFPTGITLAQWERIYEAEPV